MAEHVVHLPGDLLAGALLGLLGPKPGLGLGVGRAVPLRQHELAPVADEQAPADRGALDRHALGVTVTGVLFLLGCWVIFHDHQQRFLATVPQVAGAAAVTVALVGAAFAIRPRPRPERDRPAPKPWLVGVVAVVAANLFFARPETWPGVVIGVVLIAVMTVVITRWARRAGWAAAHRLALAGGTLSAYAWAGFLLLYLEGAADTVNLIGRTILVLGVVALLLVAGRTARRTPGVP